MARAERYSAKEPIPVKQAQLIDPGAFPADISSAEALMEAADVVGVFAELERRKRAADDSLAANAASESRTLAELEMQQYMVDNPDPNDWDKGLVEILARQGAIYSSQKFSAKAKKDDDVRQEAFVDKLRIRTKIAETTQSIKNNITVSGKNLIDLMTNDDGTPEDALDIKEQIEDFREALLRKTTPELAAIQIEETLKEGKKGFYINQSKLFPDATITKMEKKKKALGKGGKDKEGLGAKDFDDIIASAYTAKALASKSLDDQQEIDRDELGQALHDGTITYDKINATSLDEREQEAYRLKMNAEALRKSQGLPIITNQLEVSRLGDLIPDIWRDRRTYDEVKAEIDDARFPTEGNPLIDDTPYATLIGRARTQMVKVQADSHSRIMRDVRSELRVKDESMMILFLAAIDDKEERNLAETTNQRQAERANAFEEQMYEWLKDNPKATRDDYERFKAENLPHFRTWEPGMPMPITEEREEDEFRLARAKLASIFEKAKIPKQTIYEEIGKLGQIWEQLSVSEQLKIYEDLASGIKAESILNQYKGRTESPYPEYPDAFLENGIWKVIKDGKKYRIEE